MKTRIFHRKALALVGLLAFGIYVLACTSFSPDDTKILYPGFDRATGRLSVAIYDRKSGRSETLFLPVDFRGEQLSSRTNPPNAPMLRPQWMADGRRALIAWNCANDLALAVVPCSPAGGVSKFFFGLRNSESDNDAAFFLPLPVDGERVFLRGGTNSILRLDLGTGAFVRHYRPGKKDDLILLPAADARGVFYLEQGKTQTFGRIDPETLTETPLLTFTNKCADGSFFTYDPQGKRVALVEEVDSARRLLVFENGEVVFSRPLALNPKVFTFGNAVVSRKGDLLLASYQELNKSQTNSSFGLIEIPLSSAPVRLTRLISNVHITDDTAAFLFQISVSHDGKTAACSSSYLACNCESFNPEDSALFLIDLKHSTRKLTKVPIALPPKHPRSPV